MLDSAMKILPGTGRGTATRSGVVEGAPSVSASRCPEQVNRAPHGSAMSGGHGGLLIPVPGRIG